MIPTERTRAGTALDLATERQESLKAGMGGAFCFTIACTLATIINEFADRALPDLSLMRPGASLGLELGAIVGCGFLFGATYRHARRTDTNPFLRQGIVLAFARDYRNQYRPRSSQVVKPNSLSRVQAIYQG